MPGTRTVLIEKQGDVSTSVASGGTVNTIAKFTGAFRIGDSSITDNGSKVIISADGFIGSGQGFVVGNDAQIDMAQRVAETQILGTTSSDSATIIAAFSATDTVRPTLTFFKSGNATIGGNTTVADNEALGGIEVYAADGTSLNTAVGQIQCNVDDSSVAAGQIGGEWLLRTATSGGVMTTAVTIGNDQLVTLSGDLTFGTSPTLSSTTSLIVDIGGNTVGTWTATGLAIVRTGGDLEISSKTTTSGVVTDTNKGFDSSTNLVGSNAGSKMRLEQGNTTDGNYVSIEGLNGTGDIPNAIKFVFDSHSNDEGSIHFLTRSASGSALVDRAFFHGDGYFVQSTFASAIGDSELSASQSTISVDETNNSILIKVKYADGSTVKTTSIGLS